MNTKFSDLLVRVVVGLFGATIIIFCLVFDKWTVFGFGLIVLIFSMREYVRLADLPHGLRIWSYLASISLYCLLFFIQFKILSFKFIFLLLPMAFGGLVVQMFQTNHRPLRSMATYFLGLGYVALPLSMMVFLIFWNQEFTYEYLMGLFILTWCMDSGAYFAGSAFGKHKLFEQVSPEKSWEGAIGGVVLSLVGGYALSLYFMQISQLAWILAAIVVSVSGLFGDLVESYMKRIGNRKDSGSALPGHGGFLDRFDSLFFAIPCYLVLIRMLVS